MKYVTAKLGRLAHWVPGEERMEPALCGFFPSWRTGWEPSAPTARPCMECHRIKYRRETYHAAAAANEKGKAHDHIEHQ